MQQWYEEDGCNKKRFLREIEYVKEYRRKFPKSLIEHMLYGKLKQFVVKYTLEYNGKVYGIWCTYPFIYPKVRIEVRVFDINQRKIEYLNEGYHNSNGILCLLLHYPNQWNEEYGIEFIIKRVEEWFKEGQYDKNNIIPIDYNMENEIFIFPEPLNSELNQEYGIFEYHNIREKLCIATAISANKQNLRVENLPKSISVENIKKEKGIIIFTSKCFEGKIPANFSDIKNYLNCFKCGVKGFIKYAEKNGICFPIPLIIFHKNQSLKIQAFLILNMKDRLEIKVCRSTHFRVFEDIFSREENKDGLDFLRKKKVGLVGLGAIGSVIATELARSGIGNFILIDYDKLEIQNIGRHDLTLRDIDKFKVEGVKEKILDINPTAKCQCYNFNVLDDYSLNLFNLLGCDLVISTMDDQEAKYAIDSTLVPKGKKILYSGSFYNSVAGFVLVSDKKMGCFKCISQMMDYKAEKGEIPDFSVLIPTETEYNCGLPTFPGGSINTHTVSLLTAKIAIDILLGQREINNNGYPYNLYLLGNEKIMIGDKQFFEGYMDIKKFAVPGIEGCEVCDKDIILSTEEIDLYNSIMEQYKK